MSLKPNLIKCEICGKEFEPKRKDSKFCSDKCSMIYHNGNAKAKYISKPKLKKICPMCGKEFLTNTIQKYCSAECRIKGRAEYQRQRNKSKTKVTRSYTKKIKSRPMTPALERFFTKFALLMRGD